MIDFSKPYLDGRGRNYVDVSMEDMDEGRPPKRLQYGLPLCMYCNVHRPKDCIGNDDMREVKFGCREFFLCCRCGIRTNSGIFAMWPSNVDMPTLSRFVTDRYDIIHKMWEEGVKDPDHLSTDSYLWARGKIDSMKHEFVSVGKDEFRRMQALPELRVGDSETLPTHSSKLFKKLYQEYKDYKATCVGPIPDNVEREFISKLLVYFQGTLDGEITLSVVLDLTGKVDLTLAG
jgi:hypothetical protein